MNNMRERREDLYAQCAAAATDCARNLGLPADRAETVGAAVADALAEHFAGQMLSFPINAAAKLSELEREIALARRDGASWKELIRRYGMTERGLRRIIKRAPLRDPDLDQGRLFRD